MCTASFTTEIQVFSLNRVQAPAHRRFVGLLTETTLPWGEAGELCSVKLVTVRRKQLLNIKPIRS